ncbi:MAG: tRNA lysidine(34) synthetase TilS [Clostridia bacterium]|nr:tRNA lysidine(34) synthetase TilS [Clostridia bacterium]
MNVLSHTVLWSIRLHNLIPKGSSVIVGVSGGADSVALLHVLSALREELGYTMLKAVHVHHGLREETADRDERFVQELCRQWDIPLSVYRVNVLKEASVHHESLEEAGRRCRYACFEKEAALLSDAVIATAHSQTDSAESVLLNLVRGCGPSGLCGIPICRGNIVRPLLYCTAEDIRAYCDEEGLTYVVDETNLDVTFSRNRVRHEVIPPLTKINRCAVQHIAAASELVKEEHSFVLSLADVAWQEAKISHLVYRVAKLAEMDPVLFKNGLQVILRQLGGHAERVHIAKIFEEFESCCAVSVAGGLLVKSDGEQLSITRLPRQKADAPQDVLVLPPCQVTFNGVRYNVHRLSQAEYCSQKKIHKNLFNFCVSYDMISKGAVLRSRLDGDRFRPYRRACTKSLKKWCNEEKIPTSERDFLPLLCDMQGILAILGYAVDERAAVTDKTEQIAWFEPVTE